MPKYYCIFIICFIATSAFAAHARTDEVVIANGNHVTCEILSLEKGSLDVRTDSMSYVNIRWRDVLRVSSSYIFFLEDTKGKRYEGSLKETGEPGKLEVISNTETIAIELASIVSIYPLGNVWRRFEGQVDFGYTYAKSSAQSQLNLSSATIYHGIRWEGGINATSLWSKSNGETNAANTTVAMAVSRYLGSNWFLLSAGQYQHNLELKLDSRYTVLGGAGRRLIHTNMMMLRTYAGVSYAEEKYSDIPSTNETDGVLAASFDYFKLYSPKVDVTIQFYFFPSFSTAGRRRTEFNAQTKFELIHDFYWNVSFYDSYDSLPPSAALEKSDYGITTGISWTFGK